MASTSDSNAAPSAAAAPKSFARRDRMAEIQATTQKWWDEKKIHEQDAPEAGENVPKYLATFPYPYMNGKLHLGHAFTITKAEFAARYQRLLGKRSLFPFAFHCTGMPIQAAANKLRHELEAIANNEEPPSTPADRSSATATTAGDQTKKPGKYAGKKSKAVAKSGTMSQAQILKSVGVPAAEIPNFVDPRHWLEYFPPYGKQDLTKFGVQVDWRRSFITTDANPYYDAFVRWQFKTLKSQNLIAFGKRATIYSPLDGQACADHDRSSGEGVNPQEYTLIKMAVVRNEHGKLPEVFQSLEVDGAKKVFFVAATLRAETMYGQTNCFLLPDGEYGAFKIDNEGTVFICSERSARNMSYQNLSPEEGKVECLKTFPGTELFGIGVKAPNCTYDVVYTLPLLTISMKKGTGVVTSVPSDAPDDFAALRDLKEKAALREKYGIEDYMVMPFEPVEIIDIPEYGRQAAVKLCADLNIKSQNDKELLRKAKELVYLKGFYEGVMIVGSCTGMKVHEAKTKVRDELIASNDAVVYYEPEREVISRSGDECLVAYLDQWYLKYGEDEWKSKVMNHVESENFNTYNPAAKTMYKNTLGWLREWACSRNFGLGTKVPWDEQFVIESLSDSTIYMSYYTIAHLLQGGILDGSGDSPLGITPQQLTDAVWDYIYLRGDYPVDCSIEEPKLAKLRREFEYWYPLDLRVSGKDLINNHLTMSLYNHAAIWNGQSDRMPQSFFTNGHVLVNGEKMSKSVGNFITLADAIERWTADGVRLALADAGDGLDDANFETQLGDAAILKLTTEEDAFKVYVEDIQAGKLRNDSQLSFYDQVFEARVRNCAILAKEEFDNMRFKQALKISFWDMLNARDDYRDACEKVGVPMHAALITQWMQYLAIMLAPIAPHWTDYIWVEVLGCPSGIDSVHHARWPMPDAPDAATLDTGLWLKDMLHTWRVNIEKEISRRHGSKGKGGKAGLSGEAQAAVWAEASKSVITLFVAPGFADWQKQSLSFLREQYDAPTNSFPKDVIKRLAAYFNGPEAENLREGLGLQDKKAWKSFINKTVMPFVGQKVRETPTQGPDILTDVLPFSELELLKQNQEYVLKALGVGEVHVINAFEGDAVSNPRAQRAVPGAPVLEVAE